MRNAADFGDSVPLEQRLVQTVWSLWETQGHAAISARALANHAGVPLSTLYNHFPSMGQVFLAAQEEALAQARRWCDAQMEHLSQPLDGPHPTGGLGTIMAALIDEWTQTQRRLAFAWREGFLLARHDPDHAHIGQGWHDLWLWFWQAVCDLCDLGQHGEWTSFVFEAEAALHMLPWRRTLDRACLEELCHGWASWLTGRLVPEAPWRTIARKQALAALPELPVHDEMTQRIANAAADIVEHQGMARLTHRAVAAGAGVSLGMVSSRFRTSVDLVRAAFEATYQRAANPHWQDENGQKNGIEDEDIEQLIAKLTGQHISVSNRLAFEELSLAVARDPSFQPFGPQLRYLRGRTSGRILRMVKPTAIISPEDAALFSNFLSGMQRAGINLSPSNKAQSGKEHIERLLLLLPV